MNAYTFNIKFTDGEILEHTVTAPSRFVAEMIIGEEFDGVIGLELVSID